MQSGIKIGLLCLFLMGCEDPVFLEKPKERVPLIYLQPETKGTTIEKNFYTFKWKKSEMNKEVGVLYYDFYFGKNKDSLPSLRLFSKLEKTVKDLENNTQYYWKVREFNPRTFEYIHGELDSIFVKLEVTPPK